MSFLGGVFGAKRKQEQFGEQALAMVRAQNGVAEAAFDADAFKIRYTMQNGEWGEINLTTVFRRTRSVTPREANRMLFTFVMDSPGLSERENPEGWEAAAPLLRPIIRQATDLDARTQGLRIGDHTLWRPVLPCLIETVVLDQPTSMQRVHPSQLAEWGVDAETVFATARANLTGAALDTVARYEPGSKGGLLHIPDTSGDLYAGALPLVDGWLEGIGRKAGARPIVFVAQNTGVLVGAEYSAQHVLHLVNSARELFDNAVREVSPVPYTLDEAGRLVPYRVSREHLAWKEIRSAEATLAANVYGAQYKHLRADLDAGRTEDFAAKVMHFRMKDGTESTMAAWTDTVPTLLPRTHNVSLTDLNTGETIAVPWDSLAAEVDLSPVEGIYPDRYRVEFHPGAETMDRLRAGSRID
ncbi:hypothetical protein GPX89_37805 [Nocardia sp. ET3-3]|uniref:Uncharacterized protein n=1 Tax=Nocardia terrae TaxID=2675851 RepID=A0A7K1V916_9NOCA|nr:hypothetical protein [Nocardia terrae]MVU82981.1 hypothetical protein [Nocardia terrae]